MSGSEADETRVLLDKTQKPLSSISTIPDPVRPMHFLTSSSGASSTHSNGAYIQEMDTVDKSKSSNRPNNYGYLEHIQSLKSSFTPEDKSLSKKVR